MGDFSPLADCQLQRFYGPGSLATAAANTKGSFVQVAPAIDFESSWAMFALDTQVPMVADHLVDIAIGAAGSEGVVLNNLIHCVSSSEFHGVSYYAFPLTIPAGSRLSARGQSTTDSVSVQVRAWLGTGGFGYQQGLSLLETYGAAIGDSGGTTIDPGAAADTFGPWTQVTASTEHDLKSLVLAFGNQINSVRASNSWRVEIGIGPSGQEVALHRVRISQGTVTDLIIPRTIGPLLLDIPKGSRISARARTSTTDATDRLFDIVVYGAA